MKTTAQRLSLIALCSGALLMTACSDGGQQKTAGQKLDAAVAESKAQVADAKGTVKEAAADMEAKAKVMGEKVDQKLDAAGQALDDTAITTAVKAKLVADESVKALDIKVTTVSGQVTLEGSAPTAAARETATRLALSVEGVKSVSNKLHIAS
ncbi:MAG: BON domain-containing protein [Zoogloeaceae bacterium]|nr:BON domain-containing protein [Zoogloeaceae bacterium]